jgi:hypothetical protein
MCAEFTPERVFRMPDQARQDGLHAAYGFQLTVSVISVRPVVNPNKNFPAPATRM